MQPSRRLLHDLIDFRLIGSAMLRQRLAIFVDEALESSLILRLFVAHHHSKLVFIQRAYS